MRLGALQALALLAGAVGGCGRADDRDTVRAVTERFFAALEAGDGQAACAQLSTDTRAQLERQEQGECREAIAGLRLEAGSPTRVQVFVTNAKADLSSGETAFLDQGAQGWRLAAIGCTPRAGKPADHPYDCELEA